MEDGGRHFIEGKGVCRHRWSLSGTKSLARAVVALCARMMVAARARVSGETPGTSKTAPQCWHFSRVVFLRLMRTG